MKSKLNILALLLVSTFALTACSDFLNPENKSTGGTTADAYFQNNPEDLLVYAYSLMKPVAKRTDVFVQGTDLYTPSHQKTPSQFQRYNYTAENSDIKTLYSQCYACINAANATIEYAKDETATKDEARFIRAYMYYVLTQQFGSVPYVTYYINDASRDYPRTELKTIYNDLIKELEELSTSTVLDQENHNGHASQRAALALLSKVYLAAGWDLETEATDVAKGTYKINGTTYFEKAADAAKRCIAGGATTTLLTMTNEEKWLPSNEGNGEEIFSVQYDLAGYPGAAAEGGHGLENHYGAYYDNPTKTGGKYCDAEDAPTLKAIQMWEKNDARCAATFMWTMYGYDGSNYNLGYFAYYTADAATQAALPIWKMYFPYTATEADVTAYLAANQKRFAMTDGGNTVQTLAPKVYLLGDKVTVWEFNADGSVAKKTTSTASYEDDLFNQLDYAPVVKKWDDPNTIQSTNLTTNDYRDIVLLHLSDIYLVAAEAELMANDPVQALVYLTAVRARAGLAPVTFSTYEPEYSLADQQDIDLILDERAKELYAEGQRWMDLRRTKQLVRYNVLFNPYITSAEEMMGNGAYKLYRPIPQAEISANNKITNEDQNPGF